LSHHIVVTTTDYLPNHSEELEICGVNGNTITLCNDPSYSVKWAHNGDKFSFKNRLPGRLRIAKEAAETRAAVGLLTSSIQIVSAGDALWGYFPGPCASNPCQNYYYGGHVIARQGFRAFQMQGVELKQLGQGGKLGHYPIHFHMARKTPSDTFVRDSSISESMTQWIVIHGTQGGFSVTLPATFTAQDQTTANGSSLVKGLATCFPKDKWTIPLKPDCDPKKNPSCESIAGACKNAPVKPLEFCSQ
jgi:hypothetical protein